MAEKLPSEQIGEAVRRRGTEGRFRRWCRKRGYSKVTAACIEEGLKSDNPEVVRMAKAAKAYQSMRIAKKSKPSVRTR